MSSLIPSGTHPNGLAALDATLQGAQSVSAAVAFVTESGVAKLAELIEPLGELELEVVARAGGVTAPAALRTLRERLGARVSVATLTEVRSTP